MVDGIALGWDGEGWVVGVSDGLPALVRRRVGRGIQSAVC